MAMDKDDVPGLSDEEWAEFERSFTAESAKSASYKEPSARQRELTAKWKKEPPRDTGWRTDGSKAASRPRELHSPVPFETPRRKPAWKRNLAWVLVALLVVGAAMGLPSLFGSRGKRSGDGTQTNGQTSYVTPLPSQSGETVKAQPSTTPGSDDPFAGSPAEDWAAGAEGIVLPAPVALGGHPKADVAKLQSQAKAFLVAANLDPKVLAGGTPEAALEMMDPEIGTSDTDRRPLRDSLRASLSAPGKDENPSDLFSRFKPSEALLATTTVKVHGSMAPSLDKEGQLQVKVDYLFVYALKPAGADGSSGSADAAASRVVVRRMMTFTAFDPKRYRVTPGKVAVTQYSWNSDGSPCGVSDGYFHPLFVLESAAATSAPSSGASSSPPPKVDGRWDPFDQSSQPTGECMQPTRT